ncbi:hypothetical protein PSm6_00380 [Pseudomonas solani]|uniref:YqaJ viral recombinase domain-containing protein n=1 Tax=Pseudomonas solani TaxID=2731552 RepID=A0ABM7L278_9PSED|nr:YqaJ viral recombinase family protein [Pseudomonas solani]BCD83631.1 hypothetical protein PSm6_00380 [Pseudomonas solani]
MIAHECEQGTPEWHKVRAGCITASMFHVARARVNGLTDQQAKYVNAILAGEDEQTAREAAGYKATPKAEAVFKAIAGHPVGEPSMAALDYAFRLAVERISGQPLDEGFETWQMKRGRELEHKARAEHEIEMCVSVQTCGFVTTDDCRFGCSADGLIGDDEGAEYKAFLAPEKIRAFHIDNDASGIMDQVQGCMWITGRKRWHIGMYCPALEPVGKQLWLKTFERDEAYIEQLEQDLWQFKLLVDQYEAKLRA